MKKSRLGKNLLNQLRELHTDIQAGKPVKQSIVRRITVKGQKVYTRETFTAPVARIRAK